MKNLNTILALLLAIAFAFFGIMKYIENPNVVFSTIADRSGMDIFEPFVRMLTGIGELVTAALLIMPKTRKLGILTGLAILIGAIGFHLSPWLGINVPGIGHGLFFTAVIMFVVNLYLALKLRSAQ